MRATEFIQELNIDNRNGWGQTPNNANVGYAGLKVMMKPSVFLQLAAKLSIGPDEQENIAKMVQHHKEGGTFGAPTLYVKVPREWEDGKVSRGVARVYDHEGRHRMNAQLEVEGDKPVETHIFISGFKTRNWAKDYQNDYTPEIVDKLQHQLESENGDIIRGTLFQTTELDEEMPQASLKSVHKQQQWIGDPASGDIGDALGSYTRSSRRINQHLHKAFRGQKTGKEPKELVKIDQAFGDQKFLLKQPLKVFSGVPESPSLLWELQKADTTQPIRAHLPAYTSTSTNFTTAKRFSKKNKINIKNHPPVEVIGAALLGNKSIYSGSHILYITVPAGYPAISVRNVSPWPNENELLLPRGLDVVISPRPIVKDRHFIWLAKVVGRNIIAIT